MATIQENIDSMNSAFETHMKNKNPGVDATTTANIEEFSLAYATAIANAIGAGSSGANMSDYVKKSGGADGVMSGKFSALNGFEAGKGGNKRIDITDSGVNISGTLNHSGGVFSGNSKQVVDYNSLSLIINSNDDFTDGVQINGVKTLIENELQINNDGEGFFTNDTVIKFKTFDIYHSGNINKDDVDLTMRHASVKGGLTVDGSATISGATEALYGVKLGIGGVTKMEVTNDGVDISGDIILHKNHGIKSTQNNEYIIKDYSNGNVSVNAADEDLFLGYSDTKKVVLSTDLYNDDTTRKLIDKDGQGNFLWGAKLGFGGDAKIDAINEGVVLNGEIRFGDENTKLAKGTDDLLRLTNSDGYVEFGSSSAKAIFNTNRDFFNFNKYIEVTDKVSIKSSQTRIENNKLFLNNDHYLQNVVEGMKAYGDFYASGEIGTESFSTGFSGSGWRINQNAEGTLDTLTIRKKLNVYAFDVQKITASNGSIWASASCSANTVTKL